MTSRGHPAEPKHGTLKEAVAPLRIEHRDRIHALARWSMAEGRPVPMEHAALILAGVTELGADEFEVRTFMELWCRARGVVVPPAIEQSLVIALDFLDAGG